MRRLIAIAAGPAMLVIGAPNLIVWLGGRSEVTITGAEPQSLRSVIPITGEGRASWD